MTNPSRICGVLAVLVLAYPATSSAASEPSDPARNAPTPITSTDIVLHDTGTLHGAIVSSEAQPIQGVKVMVKSGQRVVATATTDDKGRFQIKGLRKGQHVIQAGNHKQVVRFWDSQSAPPKALRSLAIVSEGRVVRGQAGLLGAVGGAGGGIGAGTLGLIAAGTTATVIGIDEANKDSTPASP